MRRRKGGTMISEGVCFDDGDDKTNMLADSRTDKT
jgi:hypothetical protein